MKINAIARVLEAWAPTSLAESYDNVGLLVGDPQAEATGVLINLDVTEALIDEAVAAGINLIVTHHPIWFGARKKLNGEDYVSRIIIKAIKSDVALYACHTNLDNVHTGVNAMIGKRLGAVDMRTLSPKKGLFLKLVAYSAADQLPELTAALTEAGGRDIFSASEGETVRLELILPAYAKGQILNALRKFSPGEPPTYHLAPIQGVHQQVGSGMIGRLPAAMAKADFLAHVKQAFDCGGIRYADAPHATIQKVAWCGGAGSFLTAAARRAGADAFITGDITYHKYFDNENEILLLDIGHYESEQFTSELIYHHLSESFPTFAIRLSAIKTNPVKYYS
ncbi:MAG: Nif3-like dinuclear metal center hexameric protein [Bacteroidota bacterium]